MVGLYDLSQLISRNNGIVGDVWAVLESSVKLVSLWPSGYFFSVGDVRELRKPS